MNKTKITKAFATYESPAVEILSISQKSSILTGSISLGDLTEEQAQWDEV